MSKVGEVSIYCAIYFYFLTNNKWLVPLIDSIKEIITGGFKKINERFYLFHLPSLILFYLFN